MANNQGYGYDGQQQSWPPGDGQDWMQQSKMESSYGSTSGGALYVAHSSKPQSLMGQGSGGGLMGQGSSGGMMGQGNSGGMMGQGNSGGMIGQGNSGGMMGPGSGSFSSDSPQPGWQQQSGWQKGGALLNFDGSPQQSQFAPFYTSSDQPVFNFKQESYPVPSGNSGAKFSERSPVGSQKGPRSMLASQAEVFRQANERITSRMKTPRHQKAPFARKSFDKNKKENSPKTSFEISLTPMQLLTRKALVGIHWTYKTLTCPNGMRVHVATIDYQGQQYMGVGRTKTDSTNDAAKYLLKSLGDSVPLYTEESPGGPAVLAQLNHLLCNTKKYTEKLSFVYTLDGPPFECSITFCGTTFNALGSRKKQAKAAVATRLHDCIASNLIEVPSSQPMEATTTPTDDSQKSLVGELHSKLAGALSFVWQMDSTSANSSSAVMHTATLELCGCQFTGQGSSQKKAKNAAAQQVLEAIERGAIVLPETPKKPAKRLSTSMSQSDTPDAPTSKRKSEPVPNSLVARVKFMFPDLISWDMQQSGPPHMPEFTATAVVEGQRYTGIAAKKKDATTKACGAILQAVEEGALVPPPRPQSPEKGQIVTVKVDGETTEPTETKQLPTTPQITAADNATAAVAKLFGQLNWHFVNGGSSHEPVFIVTAEVCSKTFSGSAGSKKEAKANCSKTILDALKNGEIELPKEAPSSATTAASEVSKLWPDLSWGYECLGNAQQSMFTATCVVDESVYAGSGRSKKAAKQEASAKIMAALADGTLKAPPPPTPKGAFGPKVIQKFNNQFGTPQIEIEKMGTDEEPLYHASTNIEGRVWKGEGATVEEATAGVIGRINKALESKEIEMPVMVRFNHKLKGRQITCNLSVVDDTEQYVASFEHNNIKFTARGSNKEKTERDVARQVLESLTMKQPRVQQSSPEAGTAWGEKSPLQILHEKNVSTPVKIEVVQNGPINGAIPFIAKAVVDGHNFQGSGQSKMSAKHNCAAVILAEVYGHVFESVGRFNQPKSQDDVQRGDIGGIDPQLLSTVVQEKVRNKYGEAVANLDPRYHGRKVLAGCVMVKGKDLETAEVLTVATGTKCISGESMSHVGVVVNDMHAEILVRRALKRYLYNQVELSQKGRPSILVASGRADGPGLKLAEDVRFHLYISSPPCGDSRIFISSTTKEGEESANQVSDNNPARANRGQLRVKIEAGMGTIPVKSEGLEKTQSWEAIMSGDRYLNMSCCDKVARWSLLGIQGSLLSNLVEPVYLSSVIVGSMFNQEHIYRGLYGRIKDLNTLGKVQEPFHHHCMEIIGTIAPELRNTTKAPWHAVIWQALDGSSEVLDTKTGRTINHKKSSLCKAIFYREYRKLSAGKAMPDSYDKVKETALGYQDLKKRLYMAFKDKGLGQWVGKPMEQDMFLNQMSEETSASANETPATSTPTVPAAATAATTPTVPATTTAATTPTVPATTTAATTSTVPATTTAATTASTSTPATADDEDEVPAKRPRRAVSKPNY